MSTPLALRLVEDKPCRRCGSINWARRSDNGGLRCKTCHTALSVKNRKKMDQNKLRKWGQDWSARWRNAALAALGGKCVRCGFSDPRALQIDHVRGGGHQERQQKKGAVYHRHVIGAAESGKYQLLCANCNWIKRDENNEIHRKYKEPSV